MFREVWENNQKENFNVYAPTLSVAIIQSSIQSVNIQLNIIMDKVLKKIESIKI